MWDFKGCRPVAYSHRTEALYFIQTPNYSFHRNSNEDYSGGACFIVAPFSFVKLSGRLPLVFYGIILFAKGDDAMKTFEFDLPVREQVYKAVGKRELKLYIFEPDIAATENRSVILFFNGGKL
jgi:hypothetical protein